VVLSRRGGSLLVYDLDPERWLELTCGMVNRNLTAREWEVLLGDFSYECTCLDRPPGAGAPIEACP
jgi:hypothetical protein